MIDLRSDTLTRPTAAMRAAMADAEVGDDVYAEDPTITALEERVAAMLGHEAGLFCVTGSLSNLLGVWLHTAPGTEVLCDRGAHIVRAEMGAHAVLHGVTTRTWFSSDGVADVATITELVAHDAGPFLVRTAAIELENTHNFGGGTVQPLEVLEGVRALCDETGLALHVDGARLWNAHVATGVPLETYGRLADSISVCFSKGLGAPVGSMLLSSQENIARARMQRKRLGAAWRQAGLLAAAVNHALDHHVERLADDHAAARALADEVAAVVPRAIDPVRVQTNIVLLTTTGAACDVVARAAERGIAISATGPHTVRAVTHLDVSHEECVEAGKLLAELV